MELSMKWIWIIIALVVVGVGIFLLMNRPAVLLIRKTFQELTGMELVDSKEFAQMKADNTILQFEVTQLKADNKKINLQADSLKYLVSLKKVKVDSLTLEIQEYEPAVLTVDDHLKLFDDLTEGTRETLLDGLTALVDKDRIVDASQKLSERLVLAQNQEVYQGIIQGQEAQISALHSLTAKLETANENMVSQIVIQERQLMNCYAAHDDIEKQAKRTKRIGYIVGAAGILFALIL